MNDERLKRVFFKVKENAHLFSMKSYRRDVAYFGACVACGEDLHGKTVVEYRGVPTHVEDITTTFLQASEEEADVLFYVGRWPDVAWRIYNKGDRLRGLLLTVNYLLTHKAAPVS